MLTIENEMPLAVLTVGQFKNLLTESINNDDSRKYVYGLKGIQKLFNVSHPTAQKYKDGILKPAITQNGKKIIIDIVKAKELYYTSKESAIL